jgi:chromosome partitioning protein
MPVIVPVNPKGGSGKSTTCLALATTFAASGASVKIIDADPQASIQEWGRGSSKYRQMVEPRQDGEDLVDTIDRLSMTAQFVFVDLQGSASLEMAEAISRATLVLIPMQAKTEDMRGASKAVALIGKQSKILGKEIPFRILFVRTNPQIQTKDERRIRAAVQESSLPFLSVSLHERVAFANLFSQKSALDEMTGEVNGLSKAQENVLQLAQEILQVLPRRREVQHV